MKINYLAVAILSSAFIFTDCSKANDAKTPSKEELLTGNSSKSWNITFSSFDEEESDESCKSVNAFQADNKWIFKVGGDFEFDNGSIYEIANCPTCNCGDFSHFVGNWTLSSKDTLRVTGNGRIESNGQITPFDEVEVLRTKITSITANEIIIGVKPTAYIKFEPK